MTCSAWPFSLYCFQFWKAHPCAFLSPALWSHPTSPSRALAVTLPARFSEEHVNPIIPRFVRRSWSTEVNRLESLSAQTGSPGYAWQLRCATGSLPAPGSWERGKVRGKSSRKKQQQDLLWKKGEKLLQASWLLWFLLLSQGAGQCTAGGQPACTLQCSFKALGVP